MLPCFAAFEEEVSTKSVSNLRTKRSYIICSPQIIFFFVSAATELGRCKRNVHSSQKRQTKEKEDMHKKQVRRNPAEVKSQNRCRFNIKLDQPPAETTSKTKKNVRANNKHHKALL